MTNQIKSSLHRYDHIEYRIVDNLWYGPIKNAYNALSKVQTNIRFSITEYLDFMKENFPEFYASTEWITFQKFDIKGIQWRGLQFEQPGFKFRLALTYMKPIPKCRDGLFREREIITSKTGWYPLVLGSRAKISLPEYIKKSRLIERTRNQDNFGFVVGDIVSVRNVSKNLERADRPGSPLIGNAILLEGSRGNILLDTGFDVNTEELGRLRAVFLSHLHQDHAGGFSKILEKSSPLFLMSDITLAFLYEKLSHDSQLKNKFLRSVYTIDTNKNKLHTDGLLETYKVFHAPGSYGLVYKDSLGNALFYPGDLCIKNGFLNYSQTFFSFIDCFDAKKKIVLLDAAMVRKKDFSFEVEDTPTAILEELHEGIRRRNVLFVTSSIETSIYTFIIAFHYTTRHDKTIKLVINDQLYALTQRLIQPVLRRDKVAKDPLIEKLFGGNIENFIESHRVYPLSALENFTHDENLVIFATISDLTHPLMQTRLKKGDVIIAGTQAWADDRDLQSAIKHCRVIHRVDSPDWSFHSSETELANIIKKLSDRGIRSILFHNGSDTLKKWIKENLFDMNLVSVLHHKSTFL